MSRFSSVFLAVFIAFPLVGGCLQDTSTVEEGQDRASAPAVDSLLSRIQNRHAIPALAAAVVRSDSVVTIGASGVRRKGEPVPVSSGDWFHLGSNTKAMTATLVALLVEEGKLSWDTTPLDVFSELADSVAPAYRTVTIEQLLAHRSGLPPFTDGSEFSGLPDFDGTPAERREAFTKYLLQQEPSSAPGSKYLYSNAGYSVVATMTEQRGNGSWEEMMRRRLFEPLDIEGGFGWPAAVDSTQPWGHRATDKDTLRPHDPNGPYELDEMIAPAGDAYMSVGDYARFLRLHLRGLRGRETKLLDPSTVQYMHESSGPIRDQAGASGYGLGWLVDKFDGVRTSAHAGSAGTFRALAAIQPARNLAVGVVANAGNEAAVKATAEARDSLLKRFNGSIRQDRSRAE